MTINKKTTEDHLKIYSLYKCMINISETPVSSTSEDHMVVGNKKTQNIEELLEDTVMVIKRYTEQWTHVRHVPEADEACWLWPNKDKL